MASKDHQNTDPDVKTGDGSASLSKKKKMTPEEQSARFIETARELQTDKSAEAFQSAMGKLLRNSHRKE